MNSIDTSLSLTLTEGRVPRTPAFSTPFEEGATNFYRRFPGDYLRDTQHLTTFEHGVYTLLLDTLYATEKPIASMQDAFQIAKCKGGRAYEACSRVVLELFLLDDQGRIWHKRVDEEIKYAESRRLKASKGGIAKAEKAAPSMLEGVRVKDFRHQTTASPLPPFGGNIKRLDWWDGTIEVDMGRKRRMPSLDSYQGGRAKDVIAFLNRKGFMAKAV